MASGENEGGKYQKMCLEAEENSENETYQNG